MPPLDGQPITDANSLTTGDAVVTFDTNGNNVPTFSTAQAYNGNMSLYSGIKADRLPTQDDQAAIDIASLITAGHPNTDVYFRTYMYIPTQTLPSSYTPFITFGGFLGAFDSFVIGNGNSAPTQGRFMLSNYSTIELVAPSDWQSDAWFRLEFVYTTASSATLRIWNDPTSTGAPDIELGPQAINATSTIDPTYIHLFAYGDGSSAYPARYLDGVSIGTTGWIGTGTGDYWNNNFDESQGPSRKKSAGLMIPN